MTDKEYIKMIPNLTVDELLEKLDYCGYDSYYRTIREPIVVEISKRLHSIDNLERQINAMKCCENCDNFMHKKDHRCNSECKNLDKWELKKND